jgi:hypothetical protein
MQRYSPLPEQPYEVSYEFGRPEMSEHIQIISVNFVHPD